MLRVAALLLQLTLWAATVHAFFPFIPDDQCDPDEHCGPFAPSSRRSDSGSGRTSEGITLDLYHKPSGNDDSAKTDPIARATEQLTRKFGGLRAPPTSELDKRKNEYSVSEPAVPTTSNSAGIYQAGPDYSYFIKAQVGSAQQSFYMLLDTGAANSWLMGSDCQSDACKLHTTFDPSSSKTWRTDKKGFSIAYGSGDLTGIVGQDKASLAGLNFDFSFGVANYTHNDFKHFAFDGILGLAMSSSVTGTFLQTLKANKVLSSLIVGISLNRDSDGTNDGQVTFGGVDKAKYTGEISYTNIQSPEKEAGEWAIPMDGVGFNGKSVNIGSAMAYIDTGTSFVFAPPDDLVDLFKLIPGSSSYENAGYVEYQIPCDTNLPIHVTFSGVDYEISAADWVVRKDEKSCISRIYGYEIKSGTWLLGDTFLKNVYSVFDADKMRIGFASKPAPPPKPTSTSVTASASATASATTLVTAVTSLASDGSAHPQMPGFSGQETPAAGTARTTTGAAAAQTVSPGNQLRSSVCMSMLCIAAGFAILGCMFQPMARATSHGAAAAAHPHTNSNHRRHGASSSPSGSNNKSNHSEEGVGLLAAGPDPADDDNEDDGLIVHPGDDSDSANQHHAARTPRTPNRVRFDLRPTLIDDGGRRSNGSASASEHDDHDPYPRESFDFDDLDASDPLSSSSHIPHHHHHQQQRVPLLTGIEAPSVTVATTPTSPFHSHEDAETWAAAERTRPKSSLPSAFMNMANSIIGAGIIGQPYAFRQAGLLAGIALLVGLTFVVDWTIRLIVVNSKLSGASSFQGTVEKCFGRTGLVAISVAQWAFAFGGMVAFGVIVGDSIPSVLRAVWPGLREMPVLGLLADRRAVIVVFTLGVSYPLTLYRDIAKLAKASTLALVSMAVIVVTVVVQGMMVPAEARGSLKDWRLLGINDGIFQAIGVISFAFVCHHNSLLIYGSLEKPTIDRFAKVTHYSTAVSMFACLSMALAGFLTFGDKTQGNVLNNFPADNTMVNIARLCFGLNMLTTLPLEAFVCREVMLNYYFPGEPFNMNLHLIFSSSLVFSAMVLSLVTCDLGTVFDLVGGTSAAAMAYILPPLCYIKLTTRSWKTYLAWATHTKPYKDTSRDLLRCETTIF
ncbi:hypothetical protein C8A03DRAFT_40502 [Achaetomium macrosporum]|uniref:Peptidase A1 domain-containing protein n=1 Tax=Achaetomium macrosporum TaxID=79813 RepID=A0AAN7CHA1_9PEZI|nr:hypothetical protein C8A03DRAFT_40502 [Achaetomium macrosporum]